MGSRMGHRRKTSRANELHPHRHLPAPTAIGTDPQSVCTPSSILAIRPRCSIPTELHPSQTASDVPKVRTKGGEEIDPSPRFPIPTAREVRRHADAKRRCRRSTSRWGWFGATSCSDQTVGHPDLSVFSHRHDATPGLLPQHGRSSQ